MNYEDDNLFELTEEQKIIFLKVLARLANTDGKLSDSEKGFIKEVASAYGVSEDKLETVITFGSDEQILQEVRKIDDRRTAMELVKEMCMLAHSDEKLSDRETLLIGKIGLAMGVELEKIEEISQWVIDRIIWLEKAKIIFEEC